MLNPDPYPLFPVFAFIGFLVGIIPLPWHFQAMNAGTCLYMFWSSMASLIQFVNSVVWHGNINNPAPVWCDISTKFIIGAGVGIPAASLCINRRLYKIASIQTVSITHRDRQRALLVDIGIALGIPILVMILHVVVQGHRFDILEDVGCMPVIYNTIPAYPLVMMWPVMLGSVSFVYAGLSLRAFLRRRFEFSSVVSSASSMSVNRYFRLMLLACIEMACTVPLGIYSIFITTDGVTLAPYKGWADTHFDFGHVNVVPSLLWMNDHAYFVSVELGRWIYPVCCLLFFSLFGFAGEARRHYKMAFWFVAKPFGLRPSQSSQPSKLSQKMSRFVPWSQISKSNPITSHGSLPIYMPPVKIGDSSIFMTANSASPSEKSFPIAPYTFPVPPRIKADHGIPLHPIEFPEPSSPSYSTSTHAPHDVHDTV